MTNGSGVNISIGTIYVVSQCKVVDDGRVEMERFAQKRQGKIYWMCR